MKDESISNFISRVINKKENLNSMEKFSGTFESNSEEWEEIEISIYKYRLKNKLHRKIES